MYFKTWISAVLSASAVLASPARRDMSICDKYTVALLKDNTPANQYLLLTLVVNTVVIGNYTQPNVGISVPGILAPANYMGEQVNLLPYFNGCLKSTNVDNMPEYVNFLDGGGAAPLMMNKPANDMNSNQYGLLTHLYQFFGKLLGCSGYGQMGFPSYQGDPSMYRVHKFMDLDAAEVGYFISQVGAAALSFGVSQADAMAVGGALQKLFGYKCSPPVSITDGPQLQSICIGQTCPKDANPACQYYQSWYESPKVNPSCGGYGGHWDKKEE